MLESKTNEYEKELIALREKANVPAKPTRPIVSTAASNSGIEGASLTSSFCFFWRALTTPTTTELEEMRAQHIDLLTHLETLERRLAQRQRAAGQSASSSGGGGAAASTSSSNSSAAASNAAAASRSSAGSPHGHVTTAHHHSAPVAMHHLQHHLQQHAMPRTVRVLFVVFFGHASISSNRDIVKRLSTQLLP